MGGTSILVVDDAPVNLKLIRYLLTHEGFDVRTSERAEDALDMLSTYRPELILADVRLPGMDGLEMTRRLKRDPRTSGIRVVALTGCATKEDQERARLAGCEDTISKPIDTATLPSKLRELLRSPSVSVERPAAEFGASFPGPEVEKLRRRFLGDGIVSSRLLLDSLGSSFDSASAGKQLHEWTGCGTLFGHPEISNLARKAEALLRDDSAQTSQLREAFTDLFLSFSQLQGNRTAPVPDYIVQATSGKRVALIGFTMERADEMCELLESVKARTLLFDVTDGPDSPAIGDCDLVLFHVRPETLESPWTRSRASVQRLTKVIFTGDQRDLILLAPEVRSHAVDFLVDRGEPGEVLMRLAFAFSRRSLTLAVSSPLAASFGSDGAETPRAISTHPNIVLADDDRIIVALVGSTLKNHGMSCQSVDNGIDALSLIRRERPHAAVLDVHMPGMTGYEVLAAIRAENIPSRVILLTVLQQEDEIVRAFRLGADDFLSKPFSPFELVARLKRLLRVIK